MTILFFIWEIQANHFIICSIIHPNNSLDRCQKRNPSACAWTYLRVGFNGGAGSADPR